MGILKKFFSPFVLIIIPLILTVIWFHKGLLFAGGEESLMFHNPEKTFVLYNSIWYDADSGYQNVVSFPRVPYFYLLSLATKFGFSNILMQAMTFFVLLSVGSVSIYFILGILISNRDKELTCLIGGVFYLLNPYSMSQIWGRGLTFQFFAFALVPVFFLLFLLGLQKRNLIYGLGAILASFLLSPAYAHPAIVLTSWTSIILYFLFHILTSLKEKRWRYFDILYILVVIILWFAVNSFWITPLIKNSGALYDIASTTDAIPSLEGVSIHIPLHIVIRLMHNGVFYVDKIYGNIYSSILFLLISWLIPFVSIFSIKKFGQTSSFKFFVALFLISLFFGIGSNFPTGWLLIWLFKIFPLLQVLRSPYEKFGINLVFAYVPFFAIGTIVLAEKLSNRLKSKKIKLPIIAIILFLVCGVFVWPMWNGTFAGGIIVSPWVRVPNYYKEANDWLKRQGNGFRILQVPIIPGDGIKYAWDYPFQGIEPSEFLFDENSISKDDYFNKEYYTVLVERFGRTADGAYQLHKNSNNKDFRDKDLYLELVKLNVHYIVLHKDINWKFSGSISPEATALYLSKQTGIHRVHSFGELDIYQVDVPITTNQIYSPDAQTSYFKNSATSYTAKVINSQGEVNLYFLDRYNPNWEAYIDGNKITNHFEVFSYANAWKIKKKGDFNLLIEYRPQRIVEIGYKITKISLSGLFICIIILFIWQRIKLLTQKLS